MEAQTLTGIAILRKQQWRWRIWGGHGSSDIWLARQLCA